MRQPEEPHLRPAATDSRTANRKTGSALPKAERQARRAADPLPLQEPPLRTLVEALPQLVRVTTPDGMPDYFKRQWHDYTAFTVTPDLETNWSTLLHPDDWQRAAAAWQRAVETGESYEVEYRLRRHDGVFR